MNTQNLLATFVCLCVGNVCRAQDVPLPQKPHVEELHPAFHLSPDEVNRAIKIGQDAARKKDGTGFLLNKYKQKPHWVIGKGGKSHESAVWIFGLDGVTISAFAWDKARKYETLSIPPTYIQNGFTLTELKFEVLLTSVPHIATRVWERERRADEQDVKVVKFVLSDDQGHNYTADDSKGKQTSGITTFTGVTPVPTTGSINTSSSASANVYGSDGSSAYGTANGHSTSTYQQTQYVPWTQQRPYYQSRYVVAFGLFDAEGHAKIRPEVKTLTLHIITESGELSTEYKLPDTNR